MAHLTADENFWTGFKCEEEEGLAIKKNSEGTYLGSQSCLYLLAMLSWASYFSVTQFLWLRVVTVPPSCGWCGD